MDTGSRAVAPNDAARRGAALGSTVTGGCTGHGYADQVGRNHSTPHDVRRFVGTQLAKRDIRKAQKAFGPKRIDTTAQHDVVDELEAG